MSRIEPPATVDELVTDLITAFEYMEKIRVAVGDPAARGVRDCLQHMQDLKKALDTLNE